MDKTSPTAPDLNKNKNDPAAVLPQFCIKPNLFLGSMKKKKDPIQKSKLCYSWLYDDKDFEQVSQGPTLSHSNLTKMYLKGTSVLEQEIKSARSIESDRRIIHDGSARAVGEDAQDEVIIEDSLSPRRR